MSHLLNHHQQPYQHQHHRRKHRHRHKCGHPHHQQRQHRTSSRVSLPYPDLLPEEEHQVVAYSYRFATGDDGVERVFRDELPQGYFRPPPPPHPRPRHRHRWQPPSLETTAGGGGSWADAEEEEAGDSTVFSYLSPRRSFPAPPPPSSTTSPSGAEPPSNYHYNSQSNSPVFTATTGSSPEAMTIAHQAPNTSPEESHHLSPPPLRMRSALRLPNRRGGGAMGLSSSLPSRKSVQWVSDLKKRPQDISEDRKVVKRQVRKREKVSQRALICIPDFLKGVSPCLRAALYLLIRLLLPCSGEMGDDIRPQATTVSWRPNPPFPIPPSP